MLPEMEEDELGDEGLRPVAGVVEGGPSIVLLKQLQLGVVVWEGLLVDLHEGLLAAVV